MNGNEPAFPSGPSPSLVTDMSVDPPTMRWVAGVCIGLTKREWLAGMALQGILAHPASFGSSQNVASEARICADALLAELAKGKEKE